MLLVDHQLHLVKTIAFEQRHYLGDPLNAAYVFSGFEVDELLVLDIDARSQGRSIPSHFVQALARLLGFLSALVVVSLVSIRFMTYLPLE